MPSATTIPRGRPGHISLDFDSLRSEGIRHLENIATEIWTDFNAGEPGITILEALCYAITDLGYRTRVTPIADLAAGDGKRKIFFSPEEILTCAPVTVNDFRKLLIDVEGVKNAWLEEVTEYAPGGFKLWHEGTATKPVIHFEEFKAWEAIVAEEADKEKKPKTLALIAKLFKGYNGIYPGADIIPDVLEYMKGEFVEKSDKNWNKRVKKLGNYVKCKFGIVRIEFQQGVESTENPGEYELTDFARFNPKGLYKITLDLDDDIGSIEDKEKEAALRLSKATLHANRELCHDYLKPEVLDTEEICICIDLELDESANEKMVLAEALFRIQDFLTPTVRFYSLREMMAKGYRMDEVYNGPLLKNGFIDDKELEQHGQKPDIRIKRYDLFNVLAPKANGGKPNIPGLKSVNNIEVKRVGKEGWGPWEITDEKGKKIKGVWKTDNPALEGVSNFKYRINPSQSQFRIKKAVAGDINPTSYALKFSIFKEEYERLLLERTCKYCMPQSTQSPPALGKVRTDISRYDSIQNDFPGVYHLGDHHWPDDAPAQKIGPMRQLQAYLLFFDQILAAYLQRLGDMSKLLAVEQDPSLPSYVLPTLFEVPGMQKLLETKARFRVQREDWAKLGLILEEARPKDADPSKDDKLREALSKKIAAMRDASVSAQNTTMPKLRQKMNASLAQDQLTLIENYFWNKFVDDGYNNFRNALKDIAESVFQRQNRRNIMLDHLLARFGERFADFVVSLIGADLNPEDNPNWDDFDEYLQAKATYLMELPGLGANRGRGYNYRGWDESRNHPDVWNSTNVAGVKKRVSYQLDLDVWESRTLLGEPPYTLDVVLQMDRSRAQYHVALRRNTPPGAERLDRSDILMITKNFPRKQQALDTRRDLYKILSQTELYALDTDTEDESKRVVQFKKGALEMRSEGLEPLQAEALKKLIVILVSPRETDDFDGFHLLEHILLRPNEERDELLKIALGGIVPPDPYSNIVTIIAPKWTRRFKHERFRLDFEKVVSRELPCYVLPRFCWVDRDALQKFEDLFKIWMEEKSKCSHNSECRVTDAANALIRMLNETACSCDCNKEAPQGKPC